MLSIRSKVKPVFNSLVVLTICSDAYILRSGDFHADSTDGQTNYFTPCACAWGNKTNDITSSDHDQECNDK